MSTESSTERIEINGIEKTNLTPVGGNGEPVIFENGIVGGSISEEFDSAQRFRELLYAEDE